MTAADPLPGLLAGETSLKRPSPQPAAPPERPPDPKDTEAEPLTRIEKTWYDLKERLPKTVAMLKVIPRLRADQSECFQLEMYSHEGSEVANNAAALSRQGRPKLVLADRLVGEVDPSVVEECYDELLTGSYRPELTSWLTKLRRTIGDNLQLIVWDDTDFGISWELFWHDMKESPAWLGTVAEITHWVNILDDKHRDYFSAQKSITTPNGKILYFEDPNLVDTDGRKSIRNSSKPDSYVGCNSLIDLFRMLDSKSNSNPYGLVYIRCHGKHHDSLKESMLDGVSLMKASPRPFPALRRDGPLVFLNACNSARQVHDSRPGDNENRSFAELFLRRHASGVVATLAEVGVNYSASLPQKIVSQARNGGLRIPEFLREERAKEAQGLPTDTLSLTDDERQKILAFIQVSMFAYFGHPESVFLLAEP